MSNEILFKCSLCEFESSFSFGLTEHIRRKHPVVFNSHFDCSLGVPEKHQCHLCYFNSALRFRLLKHNKVEHLLEQFDIWPGVEPKYEFESKQLLAKLLQPQAAHRYECITCSFSSTSVKCLVHHTDQGCKRLGTFRMYKCNQCNFKSRWKLGFQNHCYMEHYSEVGPCTNPEYLGCVQCSYKSRHKLVLQRHVIDKHTHKQFACRRCPYRCRGESILQKHYLRKHQLHNCELCGYRTTVERDLNSHDNTIHLTNSPHSFFMCNLCGYRSRSKLTLDDHHKITHLVKPQGQLEKQKQEDSQSLQCKRCPYMATREVHLRMHLLYNHPEEF